VVISTLTACGLVCEKILQEPSGGDGDPPDSENRRPRRRRVNPTLNRWWRPSPSTGVRGRGQAGGRRQPGHPRRRGDALHLHTSRHKLDPASAVRAGRRHQSERLRSFLLGTYDRCVQYGDGAPDDDGTIDCFCFIGILEVTLNADDSDQLEFARQVIFAPPPGSGLEVFSGGCVEAPHCTSGGGTVHDVVNPLTPESAAGNGSSYDLASMTVFIDPQTASWIAWNNGVVVRLSRGARPSAGNHYEGRCQGSGSLGLSDRRVLTAAPTSITPAALKNGRFQ
jgi:hypothetical protein